MENHTLALSHQRVSVVFLAKVRGFTDLSRQPSNQVVNLLGAQLLMFFDMTESAPEFFFRRPINRTVFVVKPFDGRSISQTRVRMALFHVFSDDSVVEPPMCRQTSVQDISLDPTYV